MLLSIVLVLVGIGLLYWGGELLVDHSIAMAKSFGVSPMVIGLTVVAFATSAPELATCLRALLREGDAAGVPGAAQFALGNVVGSNIANVGFVLKQLVAR